MSPKSNLHFAICSCQFAIFLLVVLVSRSQALAESPLAVPVEGKPFRSILIAVSSDGKIVFSSEGKSHPLPSADLVSWGAPLEPRRGPLVVLADGGLLAADLLGAEKDRLEVNTELFGRLNLPLENLSGIIFCLPSAIGDRDRLIDRLATAEGDADRLLLSNGDELSGKVESLDEKSIKLTTGTGPLDVELDRANAVIINPQLKAKPNRKLPRSWLGFEDGTRLLGRDVKADASLQFIACGQQLKTDRKNLVFLQPLSGRAMYLSELKPAEYRHVPYLSIAWPYEIDRSVQGGMLRAGGRLYLKGIAMHSAARLRFDLPQGAGRFQAEVAIDGSAGELGSVRFRVFIDGKEKFITPPVRGGMPPSSIDVDLSGGKTLDLIVDFADRADVRDRADWLDARLIMDQAQEMPKQHD